MNVKNELSVFVFPTTPLNSTIVLPASESSCFSLLDALGVTKSPLFHAIDTLVKSIDTIVHALRTVLVPCVSFCICITSVFAVLPLCCQFIFIPIALQQFFLSSKVVLENTILLIYLSALELYLLSACQSQKDSNESFLHFI